MDFKRRKLNKSYLGSKLTRLFFLNIVLFIYVYGNYKTFSTPDTCNTSRTKENDIEKSLEIALFSPNLALKCPWLVCPHKRFGSLLNN